MLRKNLVSIIIALLLIPLVLAQTTNSPLTNPTIPQSQPLTLRVPCTINGGSCSNATTCTGTIINPNQVVLYNGINLTRDGSVFEAPLNSSDTSVLGEYQLNIACVDGVNSNSRFLKFDVTENGSSRGMSLFLILGIASLLVLFLAIFMENEYVGFLAGALFLVTGVYALIYGIGSLTSLYTRAIAYICIGIGAIFEIAAGYKVISS